MDPNYGLPLLGKFYYRNTQNDHGRQRGTVRPGVDRRRGWGRRCTTLVFRLLPMLRSSTVPLTHSKIGRAYAVKNPLGLSPSPILAPQFDVNGQLRVDDPTVQTPNGLGEQVFKDRGAFDRGDVVGPRVVLLTPRAEFGTHAGVAEVRVISLNSSKSN